MKTLRNSGDPRIADLHSQSRLGRPILVLGTLLMVMAVATGCSMAQDFDAATTTSSQEVTTSTQATEVSVALAETTTTSEAVESTTTSEAAEATTTTLAATTTTLAVTTTDAADSTTTSTETPATSAVQGTTTTVPPIMETPDEMEPEGEILYEISDWSSGISGWAAAGQWKASGGMLVTDGSSDSFAVAPIDLTDHPDYAVECEVQILDPTEETRLLLMGRMINGIGYYGGFDGLQSRMVIGYDSDELAGVGFYLDDEWHSYRLEIRGSAMRLFLEQAEVARATDNHELEPGTVGIYCGGGQINVRSFRVIALK